MARKYTKDEFLERVKKIHGDKLDFSNFVYVNSITSGKVKCNVCGHEWETRPDVLLRGCGCKNCISKKNGEKRKIGYDTIISKISNNINIDKDTYIDTKHSCRAVCKICGNVWYPNVRDLINGHGCPKCYAKLIKERSELNREVKIKIKNDNKIKKHKELLEKRKKLFEEKGSKLHNNKYNYSKVNYVDSNTKVCIICPKHGEFWQTPKQHLRGAGCKKCSIEHNIKKLSLSSQEVEKRLKEKFGDKRFVFDMETYVSFFKPFKIICKKHGEFFKSPANLLKNGNCPLCSKTHKLTFNEFVEKANIVHGDKYKYDNFEYVNNRTKVPITCKTHGVFWQTPNDHLDGCGCPKCTQSHLENEIEKLLNENDIIFEYRSHLKPLKGLELDFYIPELNIGIECQGIQHYLPSNNEKSFFNEAKVAEVKNNDIKKFDLCNTNGIKLLYYTENKFINYVHDTYKSHTYCDRKKLLEEILKGNEIGSD